MLIEVTGNDNCVHIAKKIEPCPLEQWFYGKLQYPNAEMLDVGAILYPQHVGSSGMYSVYTPDHSVTSVGFATLAQSRSILRAAVLAEVAILCRLRDITTHRDLRMTTVCVTDYSWERV